MLLSIKLAYWKDSVGKFTLQIQPVTSSACQTLIGFFGSIERAFPAITVQERQ
jgi:hypothetical protein